MNNQIITDPYFIKLQFSQEWIDIGIININSFTAIKEEYLKGEDENTEHYRWKAFHSFMQHNNLLSPEKFYMLYKIGKNEPDFSS
ncbi:MAG: hypothetical protein V7K90_25820 [Nostoc sp.]|uniref:hypothetical protein n=1 Tax=Nostoc sp. TaxID=1180 RepID=UPI002FFD042C